MADTTGLIAYSDERSLSDTQIVNLVNTRREMSASYRSGFDDRFDRCYEYYRSYMEFDSDYWYRSQLFMPYIFAMIESITPDFLTALIGGDNFFSVRATGAQRDRAQLMQELMYYQIREKDPFFQKILMWIKGMLIFGTSVGYNGWRKKTKKYKQTEWIFDDALGAFGSLKVQRERVLMNDPYFDTVYIKNCYPQPHKESIRDMGWFIERTYTDWDNILKLKAMGAEAKGVYKNLDMIKESTLPSSYKSTFEEMNSLVGIATAHEQDPINKPVVIDKYWREDRLIMVANEKVLIRNSDNPFEHGEIPYVEAKDYPLDKEFFAISDVDMLIPLQDRINDITNLRIDNIFQAVNNMYIAMKGRGIDADDVVSRPFGIIWTEDLNAIKPLERKPVAPEAFQEEELTYKAMQRVSGAWDYYQGATPERKETATGIIRLQQSALRRFGYRIKLLQKGAFKDILTQRLQMNQQLLEPKYTMEIFDKDISREINPWDIAGKMNLVVTGSSDIVGIKERMQLLWSQAKNDPYFNQLELRKRLLDIMEIPDSETLLNGSEAMLAMPQESMLGGRVNPMQLRENFANRLMGVING